MLYSKTDSAEQREPDDIADDHLLHTCAVNSPRVQDSGLGPHAPENSGLNADFDVAPAQFAPPSP